MTGTSSEKSSQEEKTGKWRWLRRAFIAVLVMSALFITGLLMMISIGGNSEALKLGLQDYFSSVTGTNAEIGELEKVTFFPFLEVKAGDMRMTSPGETETKAHVGSFYVRMSFWDILFSKPRFIDIDVTDVRINAGVLTPQPLSIEKLTFVEDAFDGRPALTASGAYDEKPYTAYMEMIFIQKPNKRTYYTYPENSAFSLESAFLGLKGNVSYVEDNIRFDFGSIAIPGQPILSGNLAYTDDRGWKASFKTHHSTLETKFDFKKSKTIGEIRFPVLAIRDLTLVPAAADLLGYLILPGAHKFLPETDINLTVSTDRLLLDEREIGAFSLPVTGEGDTLRAGPLKGAFLGGKLGGLLVLTETPEQAEFTLNASLEDADFNRLAGEDSTQNGKATITINLKGAAATGEPLPVTGMVTVSGEQGRMEVPYEAIWEADIVPGLAAESEIRVKCLIAEIFIDITDENHPCHKAKALLPAFTDKPAE